MYQETYEDYIRSILGYPNYTNQNTLTNYCDNNHTEQNEVLESCYPEIYKVVYPMICKACHTNTKPITAELIDALTNEIYVSIENDNEINVNINLTNEIGNTVNNRATTNKVNAARIENTKETRGEDRQFRNRGLQDLIRILLIRELLGRSGNSGNRPPMPPLGRPPMMPPFPPSGGPGQGPRPPMMPRDLYEM